MADARVVHEDVKAAGMGLDGGSDRVRAGDVKMQCLCRAEALGECFCGSQVNVGNPDRGAGASELLDGGFANAAGSARNEGVTAIEPEARRERYCEYSLEVQS